MAKQNQLILPEPMENLTDEGWEDAGFTRAQFEDRWRARLERDRYSPETGFPAPDFILEVLTSEGKCSGDLFQLSSLFGRPIGLVFGSYT